LGNDCITAISNLISDGGKILNRTGLIMEILIGFLTCFALAAIGVTLYDLWRAKNESGNN